MRRRLYFCGYNKFHMKNIFLTFTVCVSFIAVQAQLPYSPFPPKASDQTKFKTAGYKCCKRYEVDSVSKDSVLKDVYLYNTKGQLIQAFEIGTNTTVTLIPLAEPIIVIPCKVSC